MLIASIYSSVEEPNAIYTAYLIFYFQQENKWTKSYESLIQVVIYDINPLLNLKKKVLQLSISMPSEKLTATPQQ